MSRLMTRRALLGGATAAGGLLLAGCQESILPPTYDSVLGVGDALTFASQRLLLPRMSMAREFGRDVISKHFPAINTIDPQDDDYQRLRRNGFVDWRLPVTGLVARPASLSLQDLHRLPSRAQITQHNCEQGWSAIAEWQGVTLARILERVGALPQTRYIVFHCTDGWWDSLDMFDALHPQTLLTYGMNGRALPVQHGGPVRLRVERQLGYKSLKFVNRIEAVADLRKAETGKGSRVVSYGYSWYAGI